MRSIGRLGCLLVLPALAMTLMGCPSQEMRQVQAIFQAYPSSGYVPLRVQFVDLSEPASDPIEAWNWRFGDGTVSTDQNPRHTYTKAGTYSVSFTAMAADGSDSLDKASYIRVWDTVPPVAAFKGTPVSGDVPLTVQFADASKPGSSPITQWIWDFGDGATTEEQNPEHIYTIPGTYTVTLKVVTKHGTDEEEKEDYVKAKGVILPTAAFSATPTSGKVPLTVTFKDASIPGTSEITKYAWNFGDGTTSSDASPIHTYVSPGKHTVALKVTTDDGTDTETKTDYISLSTQILTFGGAAVDRARALVEIDPGEFVLAGDTQSSGAGQRDACLVKVGSDGLQDWIKTFGGARDDFANALALSADGGLLLAGGISVSVAAGYQQNMYLVKTDASGNRVWSNDFASSDRQYANGLLELSGGGVVLAGTAWSNDTDASQAALFTTDGDGNDVLSWSPEPAAQQSVAANGITGASDGGIVVTGMLQTLGEASSLYLAKFSTAGQTIWSQVFGEGQGAVGMAVTASAKGGFIAAGSITNTTNSSADVYLARTNASGSLLWSKTFGGSGEDRAYGLIETADGGIVIVGETASSGAGLYDIYVIKTDAQGKLLWSRTYGGAKSDRGYAVIETLEGGLAMAGSTESFGAGSLDMCLIVTDASGNPATFFAGDDKKAREGEMP